MHSDTDDFIAPRDAIGDLLAELRLRRRDYEEWVRDPGVTVDEARLRLKYLDRTIAELELLQKGCL